jgi:protein TilB
MKQKNEGGWDFYWDEESKPGNVVLEVKVAKYLDSSLIDVDVHPTYVSVIIKSKVGNLDINLTRTLITFALFYISSCD